MRRSLSLVLASALSLAGTALPAQTTINGPAASGASNAGYFGYLREGQTFQAPSAARVLQSFSFSVWDVTSPTELLFEIFAWSGSSLTGPALFSATLMGPGPSGVPQVSFATGGLSLDPSRVYAAVLARSGADAHWGVWHGPDSYSQGSFIRQDGGGGWTTLGGTDAAFSATFTSASQSTVTPEPVSMALLGTGLAGVGALRRRRRKAEAAEAV